MFANSRTYFNKLVEGKVFNFISIEDRWLNPLSVKDKLGVKKYFVELIKKYVTPNDIVLDFGCGSGGFLFATAPYCKHIIGVDIADRCIEVAKKHIKISGIKNIIEEFSYNGLTIAPRLTIFNNISDLLTLNKNYKSFKWLLPKLFIRASPKN
ncbi:MAG: class I SAM-dependent methyltransferase [Candidatus Omnitrophica bacterium]|nr:class I SAM-dependent methyltransferase [Candidatus Omnitrophota bacterium]